MKLYILKGRSEPKKNSGLEKKKLDFLTNDNKLKPKIIFQKENSKKNIPKPFPTHFDLKLKKHNQINSHINKKNETEIINGIGNIFANTSSTYFKDNEIEIQNKLSNNTKIKVNKENNFIDNALINIRGISIPGKDTENKIKLNPK